MSSDDPRSRARPYSPLPAGPARVPVPAADQRYRIVPQETAPERHGQVAFLGGSAQRGHWSVARHNRIVAVMGGAQIDLREAQIPEDGCVFEVFCMFGGVEIIVPPGVRVEYTGSAFVGGVEVKGTDAYTPDPAAPVIRVRGSVYFGGVSVAVRRPGAVEPEEE